MAEGMIEMSQKERARMVTLDRVERRAIPLVEAAEQMGIGYRQAKRIAARYRKEGAAGLVHRSRGRPGARGIDPVKRQKILELIAERYGDFGPTLIAEKLEERHNIVVDHETVRRWMKAEGMWAARRERKHRRRRKRRSRFGELVQIDGSHHAWFEDRAPPCCLMVMIDDATGLRRARFAEQETAEAAMRLMWTWIESFEIPKALYADRKNTFVPCDSSLARRENGAFTSACAALEIEIISANSPQAKGRVERCNGVFQDRLVKELRLQKIDTIEAANALIEGWIEGHSRRFEVEAAEPVSAHRSSQGLDLGAIFAWHWQRRVNNDFTVRLENRWYQLEPRDPMPRSGSKVTLRRRLDGTLEIFDACGPLEFKAIAAPAPKRASPLERLEAESKDRAWAEPQSRHPGVVPKREAAKAVDMPPRGQIAAGALRPGDCPPGLENSPRAAHTPSLPHDHSPNRNDNNFDVEEDDFDAEEMEWRQELLAPVRIPNGTRKPPPDHPWRGGSTPDGKR